MHNYVFVGQSRIIEKMGSEDKKVGFNAKFAAEEVKKLVLYL